MKFKSYLKYLNSIDYPNQSENLLHLSRYLSYGPEEFQNDLLANLGVVGTTDFVGKTFKKLGLMSSPGYKVNLNTSEKGSYVHLIINSFEIIETNEEGELPFHVWINYSWGDNKIIHDGESLTIDYIKYEVVGMGDWSEWDEFMDSIQDDVKYEVYKQTEFFLHFDAQW